MRKLIKRILHPFLKRRYNRLAKNPRPFSYKGIDLTIYPGVFSPEMTISTKIFVDFLSKLDLKSQKVLELGAGSGLISFFAAKNGAKVTASDISDAAIEGLKLNSSQLDLPIEIIKSDLFENINNSFDYLFINPPYYPKQPKTIEEKAWFCGQDFEYFEDLFKALLDRAYLKEKVLLILSQDCDLERINRISLKYYLRMSLIHQSTAFGEKNMIYELVEVD